MPRKFISWLVFCFSIALFAFAARAIWGIFSPFIIGFIISTLLEPIIVRLHSWGIRRPFSSAGLVVLVFAGIFTLITLSITQLWQELEQLSRGNFFDLSSSFILALESFMADLPFPLSETMPLLETRITAGLSHLFSDMMNKLISLPDYFLTLCVTALVTFFLCKDRHHVGRFIARILPLAFHLRWKSFRLEVVSGIGGFFRAQFLLMSISSVLSICSFLLIGVPYSWTLGALAGLLDLIPMIGPSGVFLPVLAYYGLTGHIHFVVLIAVAWVAVMMARGLIEPQLVSSQVGLHPLTSIAALYLGFRFMGASGLILGPLVMVVCKAVFFAFFFQE